MMKGARCSPHIFKYPIAACHHCRQVLSTAYMECEFKKLCKKYGILVFILFGSEATGRANKLSDIDLAYLPRKKLSLFRENALFLDVLKIIRRDDVDLVDLSTAGVVLKYSAINFGKILACADRKSFYDFVVKTRSEYLDTQHMRQIFMYYMKKRIQAGKFGR